MCHTQTKCVHRYIFFCTWPSCRDINQNYKLQDHTWYMYIVPDWGYQRIHTNTHATITLPPGKNNLIILLFAGLWEYMELRSKLLLNLTIVFYSAFEFLSTTATAVPMNSKESMHSVNIVLSFLYITRNRYHNDPKNTWERFLNWLYLYCYLM